MATASDVMAMLMPDGGYVLVGDNYEGLTILTDQKISKKQFDDGFAAFDTWKAQQDAAKAAAKAALLAKLGITADEAALLLS